MGNVRVVLNLLAINAVMKSAPVQAEVMRRAKRIQQAAGENFEAVAKPHKWTARAYVQTANFTGRREEARDKKLTRSLDAGR